MTEESRPREVGKPPTDDAILWRYMGFDQLYDLLTLKRLTFVSPELFDDKFEGVYSLKTYDQFIKMLMERDLNQFWNCFLRLRFLPKDSAMNKLFPVFISSWHQANTENMLMWERYAGIQKGVAIQTNYRKLINILPDDKYHIGLVNYDETEFEQHAIERFFHKKNAYSNENELRIVYSKDQYDDKGRAIKRMTFQHPIEPEKLIVSVMTSPFANNSFYESVDRLVSQYNIKVQKSTLTIENTRKFDELYDNIKDVLKEISLDCERCSGKSYVDNITLGVPAVCPECIKKNENDMFEKLISKINT